MSKENRWIASRSITSDDFHETICSTKKSYSDEYWRQSGVNHRLTGITFVSCRARAWNASTARNNRSIKLASCSFRFMNRGNATSQYLTSNSSVHCRFSHVIDDFSSTTTALRQPLHSPRNSLVSKIKISCFANELGSLKKKKEEEQTSF